MVRMTVAMGVIVAVAMPMVMTRSPLHINILRLTRTPNLMLTEFFKIIQ